MAAALFYGLLHAFKLKILMETGNTAIFTALLLFKITFFWFWGRGMCIFYWFFVFGCKRDSVAFNSRLGSLMVVTVLCLHGGINRTSDVQIIGEDSNHFWLGDRSWFGLGVPFRCMPLQNWFSLFCHCWNFSNALGTGVNKFASKITLLSFQWLP